MNAARRLRLRVHALWRLLRALTGDDAYERYRAHQVEHHPHEVPLSRRAFYEESQRRKWSGVSRCC